MLRQQQAPYKLLPEACWCLQCGQEHHVVVTTSLEDFDQEQWEQKARDESGFNI